MKKLKSVVSILSALALSLPVLAVTGCANSEKSVVLRVCSWEEYIDLGGWEEDDLIDIDNPFIEGSPGIFGENSMVDDFTEWFNSTHDYKVKVEYSTFGTNEDLYNRLSLGDEYDLVCPSDYLLMKLIAEDKHVEYSDAFWDTENKDNHYARFVSPYIDGNDGSKFNSFNFATSQNQNENLHKKAACFMWGTLGFAYNPEKLVNTEDVATWKMLLNENYLRQVTVKDNVRDAYFATLGIIKSDELKGGELDSAAMSRLMNDTSPEIIEKAQDVLKDVKNNVYSFETDSGKADMVTGKVIANEQWSGDAVLIMDEAEDEGAELWYSIPEECTNIWFDGWMMLKDGINGNARKQEAAEAFVNFLSRPDNAVRNMYYIGYTSAIAGDTVLEYMDWNYGAVFDGEDEEFDETLTDIYEYDLSYFFGDADAVLYIDARLLDCDYASVTPITEEIEGNTYNVYSGLAVNRGRQAFAQYPPENVAERGVVMLDFGERLSDINRMWINVRCLDVKDVAPVTVIVVAVIIALIAAAVIVYKFRYKLLIRHKPKKGYKKV